MHFLFLIFVLPKIFSFSKSLEVADYENIKAERKMFHKRAIKLHLRNKKLARENFVLKEKIKSINNIIKINWEGQKEMHSGIIRYIKDIQNSE